MLFLYSMEIRRAYIFFLWIIWWSPVVIADMSIDHRKLIIESCSFLKKREPEMNPSEQAVYEKVAPILALKPVFALKLLNAMSTSLKSGAKPSPAFEFMMGNACYAAKHYAEAEAKYRSAVGRNPTFIRAWNNLGVLYYVQDRYADAVPCFSKALTLGDRDPTTFGLIGNSFEKVGNTISAEMAYRQALAADPANISWTEGLLRIYLAEKEWDQAETLVKTLLKIHPEEPRYQLIYVNLLLSCHRKTEAVALLEQMRATGTAREENIILLADLYAEERMTSEVLATLAKIANARPHVVEQRLLLFARTLIGRKDWIDSDTVLYELSKMQLSPSGKLAWFGAKVDVEIGRENWIAARDQLETLLKLSPADGNAWISLGRIDLAEAKTAPAIEAFVQAYQIPETSYRASIELANIEFKNHHYQECLGYLEHALGIQRSASIENFKNQIRSLIPPETKSHL